VERGGFLDGTGRLHREPGGPQRAQRVLGLRAEFNRRSQRTRRLERRGETRHSGAWRCQARLAVRFWFGIERLGDSVKDAAVSFCDRPDLFRVEAGGSQARVARCLDQLVRRVSDPSKAYVFLGLRPHGCGTGSVEGGHGVLGIRTIVIGAM
jgi:hypothetical protein